MCDRLVLRLVVTAMCTTLWNMVPGACSQEPVKPRLPAESVVRMRFDTVLDGKLRNAEEVKGLGMTVEGNRITLKSITTTGEVVDGTVPVILLRQSGARQFSAHYVGKLITKDSVVGVWFNTNGQSGDFELTIDPIELASATKDLAGPFHIERSQTRRITFEYTISADTPDDRIEKWVLNLPEPPMTGSQEIHKAELIVNGKPSTWSREKDRSTLARNFRSTVVGRNKGVDGSVTVTAKYTATMYERRLVAGRSSAPIPTLTASEVRVLTAATPTCDYRDAAVQDWIGKQGLMKERNESELQFAFRVFRAIQKLFRYEAPNESYVFRCSRCVQRSRADCGASNLLFCGVLRNSGIPARVYCGRWAVESDPGVSHSLGEFFARGVGWVPVDATAPLSDDRNADSRFGRDSGRYFATSQGTDWQIDLPAYGVQQLTWFHNYVVPYRFDAKPTWEGFRVRESFKLTER